MKRNRGWLVDDWNNRDPDDNDLNNIDDGKALSALSALSGNHRLLLQESDTHIELSLLGDFYRVAKIVKKREPEYIQGQDQYFITDKYGDRIPITEDKMDELLGINHNPEDIFNSSEVELEALEHTHTTPRDVWDVIFDATEGINRIQILTNSQEWQKHATLPSRWYRERCKTREEFEKRKEIEWNGSTTDITELKKSDVEWLKNSIYSADWFPYPVDKRIHHPRAKDIANRIKQGEFKTRQELSTVIGKTKIVDTRPEMAKQILKSAEGIRHGEKRAALYKKAQLITDQYRKSSPGRLVSERNIIPAGDRKKLWDLWRDQQMLSGKTVELLPYQYKRALFGTLLRQGLPEEEARTRTQNALDKLFDNHSEPPPTLFKKDKSISELDIDWITNTPPAEDPDEYEFTASDWLEEAGRHNEL